jgi:hypothetical protein
MHVDLGVICLNYGELLDPATGAQKLLDFDQERH